MPTPLQIEAMRLLEERKKELEQTEKVMKWVLFPLKILGNLGAPFGGAAATEGAKALQHWLGDQYAQELEKVIRGERHTLPNLSDYEGNDAGAFQ